MESNWEEQESFRLPISVQLGLTFRCNLNCSHCYSKSRKIGKEFSKKEICDLLTNLNNLGTQILIYSHGESLLRDDFFEIAENANQLKFHQVLMTNGLCITNHIKAKEVVHCGVNRVMISLDSSRPEEHDLRRGLKGAFNRAISAIEVLLEEGAKTVGISTAIDEFNYSRLDEIIQLGKKLGVHAISFMHSRHNGTQSHYITEEKYLSTGKSLYDSIIQNKELDIYTHDPLMIKIAERLVGLENLDSKFIDLNACVAGKYLMSVDPVGNVRACNFASTIFGNIREEKIEKIWEAIKQYHLTLDNQRGCEKCESCDLQVICRGGCKAFWNDQKIDSRCMFMG